jgi:SAM-dependent methyltransferase
MNNPKRMPPFDPRLDRAVNSCVGGKIDCRPVVRRLTSCPMENDQPRFFDARRAAQYDAIDWRTDTLSVVELLASLAGPGPLLELAIGTGRVALPLAARGLRVDGVDISEAMVAVLREKPGGGALDVTIAHMADVELTDTYSLVFVVANSLSNVGDQDDQVRVFENVARHLTGDGYFVVEMFIPRCEWLRDCGYVDAEYVDRDEVRLDVSRVDPATQFFVENHVRLTERGVTLSPVFTRYVWPSEMDLMARIAGLRLRERWAGWNREPFTGAPGTFVSVYGR